MMLGHTETERGHGHEGLLISFSLWHVDGSTCEMLFEQLVRKQTNLTATSARDASLEVSRPHEARSCRVIWVSPLPARRPTSHEPLAGSRRSPSILPPHSRDRTLPPPLAVLSPL